ncbi:MAG: hypothetical protein HY683_05735 [Chloroflexi bacterium]|nr:hypothetical protein [Chloroflexota bacterium]
MAKVPQEHGVVPAPQSDWSSDQLLIYAKELQQIYGREVQLRKDLEDKNAALERKLRELRALNDLFQGYLQRQLTQRDQFLEVLTALHRLAQEGLALKAEISQEQGLSLPAS